MKLFAKFFLIVFLPLVLSAQPAEKVIPELALTEMTLSNGMRVCLKATDFDDDEILVRLTSPGGFSLINPNKRASAELAASVALESGFGNLSADEVCVLLDDESVDFAMVVNAFDRTIDGVCDKSNLECFLKTVNLAFVKSNYTEEAFNTVIAREKESIRKRSLDFDTTFEDTFLGINTENLPALKPLSLGDLDRADFATSKKFYDLRFIDPSEFVCVIVGPFDIAKAKVLVEKYLSSIPPLKEKSELDKYFVGAFPPGITKKKIPMLKKGESLARLTLPIVVSLNEQKIQSLETACQVIEGRLRKVIRSQTNTTQAIDVAYELPLFPYLELSWITIQFRGDPSMINTLAKTILTEVESLQKNGASSSEIADAKTQQTQSDDYWLRDNGYWLATLTNYYMLKWDPKYIVKDMEKGEALKPDVINNVIKTYFPLNNYTLIFTQP